MSVFSKLQLSLGINMSAFVVAWLLRTEKFFDATGALTFITLVVKSLLEKDGAPITQRQYIASGCVLLWATRLGSFLVKRVFQDGEDKRFRNAKNSLPLFAFFWFLQSFWVWITSLPVTILNEQDAGRDVPINYVDKAGYALFALGFLIEVVADRQKTAFRAIEKNKHAFITTGLWKYSRHPNYFGEIVLWLGILLQSISTFRGLEYAGLISPVFVAFLLTRVSGVPILERMAMKRWGKDPVYLAYKARTATVIPWPPASS